MNQPTIIDGHLQINGNSSSDKEIERAVEATTYLTGFVAGVVWSGDLCAERILKHPIGSLLGIAFSGAFWAGISIFASSWLPKPFKYMLPVALTASAIHCYCNPTECKTQ
jgi:hypothetical protein